MRRASGARTLVRLRCLQARRSRGARTHHARQRSRSDRPRVRAATRDDPDAATPWLLGHGSPRRCGRARAPSALTPPPAPPRRPALLPEARSRARRLGRSRGSVASGSRRGRLRCSRFLCHLRLGLDVDAPAGQPRCEARVLPFLADRERELIVGHDHHGGARLLVDAHLAHLGRLQGVRDELRRCCRTTAPRRSSRRAARSRPCARASPSARRTRRPDRHPARSRAHRSSSGARAHGRPPGSRRCLPRPREPPSRTARAAGPGANGSRRSADPSCPCAPR